MRATVADQHRGNAFDFLRFMAATAVVLSHTFPLRHGTDEGAER